MIYDYFSILKVIDVIIQFFMYLSFLFMSLSEASRMVGREDEYFLGMSAALGIFLGFYQLLSFLIQLFSWYYYPEIYSSRLRYVKWTVAALIIFSFIINSNPGGFLAFLLMCFLHIVAAYYFSMSIKETKLIFYAERKE